MAHFPCWLSPKDKAIALALIETGFDYLGSSDEFDLYDFKIASILGWRLGAAYGEIAIEVVRDGAVFGKCLEVLPNIDFKQEVKLTKRVIRVAARAWDKAQAQEFTQLTLPLITECKNSHQSSSFGRKAPLKSKRSPTEMSDRLYVESLSVPYHQKTHILVFGVSPQRLNFRDITEARKNTVA